MNPKRISWTQTSVAPTRAVAVVATCGLIFGLGSASPDGSITGTGVSQSPLPVGDFGEAVAPGHVPGLFGQPGGSMVPGPTGSFGSGLSGLDNLLNQAGLPGIAEALGLGSSPALFQVPAWPGIPADSAIPGSALFSQPGPSAIKGSLAAVVPFAYEGLGRPYVWGGTSFTSGWDCSGFTQWAFAKAGFTLPRVSQWEALTPTSTPSPGDLVAQRPDGPNHWGHVGIYVGDGMMISALNPDQGTILHPVGATADRSWYFTIPGTERGPVASEPLTRRPDVSQPFKAPTSPTPGSSTSIGKQQDATRPSSENNKTDRDARSDHKNSQDRQSQQPSTKDSSSPSSDSPHRPGTATKPSSPSRPGNATPTPKRPGAKPTPPERPSRPAPGPSTPPSSKPNKPTPQAPAPKPSQPKPTPTAPAPKPSQPTPDPIAPANPSRPEPSPEEPQKPDISVPLHTAIIAALEELKRSSPKSTVHVDDFLASAGVDYADGPAGYPSLGQEVDAAAVVPGDLVYYPDDGTGKPHVAIYTGDGKAIHDGQSIQGSPADNGMPFIYIRIGN